MSKNKKLKSPLHVSPQVVPTVSKSARTRAAILNAALDFLWSHPFREMTIAALMAETDVGRSAFYPHFKDLHEVMENLLEMLQGEIFEVAEPWLVDFSDDPTVVLRETVSGLVRVCYERGPFLRAITDAATTDERLEKVWKKFLEGFDNAGTARIEADQARGLTADFNAQQVAFALNRLNTYTLLQAFGQHPRQDPEPVREALTRIWISTLYGADRLNEKPINENKDTPNEGESK
jgi:TetR/AcrR family transcriptional regulator, ethionamide resistance regulator